MYIITRNLQQMVLVAEGRVCMGSLCTLKGYEAVYKEF